MNADEPVFVVAISGISGAGKSTLAKNTAARIGENIPILHFDDYMLMDNDADSIETWLSDGADPNEFKTPRMTDDLRTLRSGKPIGLPDNKGVINPGPFVIVDDPFGRSRHAMSALINLAVHIALPLDIGLARQISRAIDLIEESNAEQLIGEINHNIKTYLAAGRQGYVAADLAARATAERVLDGTRSIDDLASDLVTEIHARQKTS